MKRLGLTVLLAACAAGAGAVTKLSVDGDTCVLLGAKDGAVVDQAGRITGIESDGVTVEKDATFGEVLRFSGAKNGVVIPDGGKIGFAKGATVEAWIWLDQVPEKNFSFAYKLKQWDTDTFELNLEKGGRFSIAALSLGGEAVDFTEEELPHHWGFKPVRIYPGRISPAHGHTAIPTGTWTHVAWTYDAARGLGRLWVNGSIDREFFQRRPPFVSGLSDVDEAPVTVLPRATGVRLAQLRVSSCARVYSGTPPVRIFVNENAYRRQGTVQLKPIRDNLPYPLEVEVGNVHPPYMIKYTKAVLASPTEPITVEIPRHEFVCSTSFLVIKLKKDGRELWRHELPICNPAPVTAAGTRFYQGEGPYDGKSKPEWDIRRDNTFTYQGKPILPLMLYFARPDNFDLVTELGFNMIQLKQPKGVPKWEWTKTVEPFFAKAAEKGVTLTTRSEVEGRPGQGFRFLFDEPYGYNFEAFRLSFMNARNGRAHPTTLPIVATQNNPHRYRETAGICDILAPDPYNKGRSPMRNIYDSVAACVEETDGTKPVMCIIGNYGTAGKWRPDREELRTMCYLAFAAGSTALGFYSWMEGDEIGGKMDTTVQPDQIESYRALFKEFKALEPALTTANLTSGAPTVEPAQPRGFFPCAKKGRDGKLYLIVASDLYRSATRKIAFPAAKGKSARLLFGPSHAGKLAAAEKLVFDKTGRADVSMPPVSSAVYVVE